MRHKILTFLGGTTFILVGLSLGIGLYAPSDGSQGDAMLLEPASSSILTPSRTVRTWSPEALDIEESISLERLTGGEVEPVKSQPKEVAKPVAAPAKSQPKEVTKPVAAPVKSQPKEVAKPVAAPVKSQPKEVAKPVAAPVKSQPKEVAKPVAEPVKSQPKEVAKPVAEPVRVLTPQQELGDEKPTNSYLSNNLSINSVESQIEFDSLRAQTGELFHLDLPERGWVLITDIRGRIQILERTVLANEGTRYTLRAIESGDYLLEFSRQQPTAYERRVVQLNIIANQGLNIEPQRLSPLVSAAPEQALTLEDYILQSISAQEIMQQAAQISAAKMTLNSRELKHAFDLLWQERVYAALASELGEAYVLRFKEDLASAEVLYRLGAIYEAAGADRNLRRSYQYYREVFDGYPITPYSRMSKERMDYLDRFFFHIQ